MAIMWEAPEKLHVGPSPIEIAWKVWLAETLTRGIVKTGARKEEPMAAAGPATALRKVA